MSYTEGGANRFFGCPIAARAAFLAYEHDLPLEGVRCCGSEVCPFGNDIESIETTNPEELHIRVEKPRSQPVQKFTEKLLVSTAMKQGATPRGSSLR